MTTSEQTSTPTPLDYPQTRRDDTVETLHGHQVADPYRWLEDPDSPETAAWVTEQNALSRDYLAGLPSRAWFGTTMHQVVGRPRAGTPDKVAGRYVVSRNDGSQQQDVWFVADTLEELATGGRVLVDPNTFSADGTSSLADYTASRDDRWLAYLVSDGGSDWTTIRLLDLATGERLDDVVSKVKFSRATWLPDQSFLYLHYPVEGAGVGTESGALPGGRLQRHVVGTPQSEDQLVLAFPEEPRVTITPEVSHDGRWLVVHLHEGTSEKNRLWAYPLSTEAGRTAIGEPLRLVDEAYAGFETVRSDGSWLYLLTDHEAPRRRVVRVDLDAFRDSGRLELHDVLPESADLLEHVEPVARELLTVHLVDVQPRLRRHGLDGTVIGDVDVAGGAVVAVHGDVDDDEVFLGMSSVTSPVTAYHLDLAAGTLTEVDLAPDGEVSWQPPAVVTTRRRATSADGTEVPYFLLRPEDVPDAGPRPTLLWGYGGFGISVPASYRASFAGWLAAGGVLAIANLRGGGEFGSDWHDAGRLERKQNVFDDFAAVAEHLVETGVTTPQQLALHGGSNGGLLVGATMVQRPDLAAVALPAVGVLDMLRFHRFTVGAAWIADYGDPDDPAMLEVLRAYSPLHNVVDGTAYPATLVTTGDHDDRVVPAHSFKFTAALQRAQGGPAPVLARIETSTGHGLGKPATVVAEETADLLTFAAEHTGLVPPG